MKNGKCVLHLCFLFSCDEQKMACCISEKGDVEPIKVSEKTANSRSGIATKSEIEVNGCFWGFWVALSLLSEGLGQLEMKDLSCSGACFAWVSH